MKKILMALSAAALCLTSAVHAETEDNELLNHLGAGISVGTPGIGIEFATPITHYVQLRAGYSFMPKVKVNASLDVRTANGGTYTTIGNTTYSIPNKVDVQGKLDISNVDILFDLFPFNKSSFHFTVGAYIGTDKVVKVYNKQDGALKDLYSYNQWVGANPTLATAAGLQQQGLVLGDYLLTPDANGNMNAYMKVSGFKPYVGLGFGRAVPMKHRLAFKMDMGVMFWNKPKVYCQDIRVDDQKAGGEGGKILKTVTKISVYPVISFSLFGRIL